MSKPLESKIETYLKQQVKAAGGLCYKFKSTVSGVPDQLVVYDGSLYLVEVKRPGEKPRANQRHVHGQIECRGVTVYNVDTTQAIDRFVREVLRAEVTDKRESSSDVTIKSSKFFEI